MVYYDYSVSQERKDPFMKLVITDAGTVFDAHVKADVFSNFGQVEAHHLLSYEEIAEAIRDADAVLCNKCVMDAHTLRFADHLKYIGLFATGYNNIDLAVCRQKGITVCNAGSYSTDAVAQHTFALILDWYSRVDTYHQFVAQGGWVASDTFSPFICDHHELYGKTIGIVGFGSIGAKVAKIAQAFGMNVFAYNRSPKEADDVTFVSLEELLSVSDIVSVHCPLNEDSKEMFGHREFSLMKKDALFVNTARGGVVNEPALKKALLSHEIAGAAIDVLTQEPMGTDCVLLGLPNCTITPHVAWAPVETRQRLIGIVADNLQAFLSGQPKNVVS